MTTDVASGIIRDMTAWAERCVYPQMTAPGAGTVRRPEEWIDDLSWHRSIYRESKFQWSGIDAVLIATEWTRGQDTFTNVRDLAALTSYQLELAEYTTVCERALGTAISEARTAMSVSATAMAETLGMTALDLDHAMYLSALGTIWSEASRPHPKVNAQVRRIRRMCSGLLFTSPLLLAWELKQLWTLYQAAGALLEDTVVDLVTELDTVDPSILAEAAGMPSVRALEHRVAAQRSERGEQGDPRRIPQQVF